jgi:hypothetical protein
MLYDISPYKDISHLPLKIIIRPLYDGDVIGGREGNPLPPPNTSDSPVVIFILPIMMMDHEFNVLRNWGASSVTSNELYKFVPRLVGYHDNTMSIITEQSSCRVNIRSTKNITFYDQLYDFISNQIHCAKFEFTYNDKYIIRTPKHLCDFPTRILRCQFRKYRLSVVICSGRIPDDVHGLIIWMLFELIRVDPSYYVKK